ncbi:unnamed protein product, partial [Iphiclides podalirius]
MSASDAQDAVKTSDGSVHVIDIENSPEPSIDFAGETPALRIQIENAFGERVMNGNVTMSPPAPEHAANIYADTAVDRDVHIVDIDIIIDRNDSETIEKSDNSTTINFNTVLDIENGKMNGNIYIE